jgi:hypothetical protein
VMKGARQTSRLRRRGNLHRLLKNQPMSPVNLLHLSLVGMSKPATAPLSPQEMVH